MKPYYQDSHVSQYCGNALDVLGELPEASVQCCVTSPPYWGLRKYSGEQEMVWGDNHCEHEWAGELRPATKVGKQGMTETGKWPAVVGGSKPLPSQSCAKCGAWRGAFGLEPTPEMYVEHTVEFLRAIRRVLRKDGVVFLNLGDSYAGSGSPGGDYRDGKGGDEYLRPYNRNTLPAKNLCLIPFRVALAAQADGWWVRSIIIWSKPNPMPESVKDRPTESHEYILLLTKAAKYYWDIDAVREPAQQWGTRDRSDGKYREVGLANGLENDTNLAGRNSRTVWTMNTQPFPEAHFAVFPEELPRRCILAASKQNDLILDCFSGAGTTGLVAKQLGRRAILIDTSEDYCRMAQRRIEEVPIPMEV